jgi:Ca2+-binding EF-hand superfamily protein
MTALACLEDKETTRQRDNETGHSKRPAGSLLSLAVWLLSPGLLVSLSPCLAFAGKIEDPGSAAPVQDLIFFSEGRPLLIRLHLYHDGQPAFERWKNYLGRWFVHLDRNRDGVLDARELELAFLPQQMQMLAQGQFFFPQGTQTGPIFAEVDADADGKITPEEFLAYYQRSVAGPVQALANPYGQFNTSEVLSEALIKALDGNKDGLLSKEELLQAPKLLARYDVNDDEVVTAQELLSGGNPYVRQVQFQRGQQPGQAPASPILLIPREASLHRVTQRLRLAKELLNRFDKDKNQKLSREEIKLPRDLFDSLDGNKDGELDVLELVRWIITRPDLEVVVRMGKLAEGQTAVELLPGQKVLDPNVPPPGKTADNTVSFHLGDSQISLNHGEIPAQGAQVNSVKQFYLNVFNIADKDKKGEVTQQQVDNNPQLAYLRLAFRHIDRNGDGKVTKEELDAWADLLNDGKACTLSITFADHGRGLFELLDANKDGRLSVHELQNAWKKLAEFDRAGKGTLSRADIPRQCQMTVWSGVGNPYVVQPARFNPYQGGQQPVAAPNRGPLWFRKMDLNGDGFVSLREFVGSPETFRKIDADGDGLISPEEAEQADARFRASGK